MDASFIPVEVVPSKTPFGLDQLRRSYKTALSSEAAIAACPAVGTADETFPFMFLMPVSTPESAESATRIDLVYMGCLADDGAEEPAPILPAGQKKTGNPVQTATTYAADGITQVTGQFYSVLSEYTWITYLAPGATGSAPAPTGTPTVISFTIGNASFSGGESELLSLFQLGETDIVNSTEIVPSKFWQNTEQRTLYYGSHLTVCHSFSARSICLQTAGSGYSVSDTLTCTDLSSNTAVMVVTAIGAGGSVTDFSITSDDISAPIFLVITATGGGGSGASFRFYGA